MNWFKQNDTPIIVIGMHRSGTTMFTKILRNCGVYIGADLSSNMESYTFTHFNESLLNAEDATWNNPKKIEGESRLDFDQKEFLQQFLHLKREPLNVIQFLAGRKWGWKDPRNTFTAPYWIHKYFPNAQIVHVYRNGLDVAKSLSYRNQTLIGVERIDALDDECNSFKLWEKYVAQAFSLDKEFGKSMIHISYEDLIEMNSSSISRVESFLGLKGLGKSISVVAKKPRSSSSSETNDSLMSAAKESFWLNKLSYIK